MIRVYFAALFCAAIFFAYIAGVHVGNVRCDSKIAYANSEQTILNAKIMEKTNEAALHTGVSDIRHILREKYTIAE